MADIINRAEVLEILEKLQWDKEPAVARAAIDTHRAIAALPAQGVRVRWLEWREIGPAPYSYQAIGPFGLAMIHEHDGAYRVRLEMAGDWLRVGNGQIVTFPTLDAAKAAAQADYEARILAAIEPAEAGGVEATNVQKMHVAPAPVDALVKAAAQQDFGLSRATQNFYRARNLVREFAAAIRDGRG